MSGENSENIFRLFLKNVYFAKLIWHFSLEKRLKIGHFLIINAIVGLTKKQ